MSTAPAKNSTARTELITAGIDKKAAGNLIINRESGGMRFENMAEVMEFAKLMSISQHAVPPHCRGQVGLCLGLAIQAIEWRMSPFAVASKSYVVNDRIGYESQLVHAVIEQRAPIVSRLRHEFLGEGAKRRCRVWATVRGETEPLEYTSPEIGKISPQNSPLWKTKPDLQLYYNTSRDWARAYFPDVILGVYAEDELLDAGNSLVSQSPAPKGVAGLKSQLMGPGDEEAGDDDQRTDEEGEGIDDPHSDDDANQAPAEESTVGMTAEELADAEREAAASGKLFDTHPQHD